MPAKALDIAVLALTYYAIGDDSWAARTALAKLGVNWDAYAKATLQGGSEDA